MKYRVTIEVDTTEGTTFAREQGLNKIVITADHGLIDRAKIDIIDVTEPRNIDNIRFMDSFDLADFLEGIKDGCYNLARYGSEACADCPLKDGCAYFDNLQEWLEAKANAES